MRTTPKYMAVQGAAVLVGAAFLVVGVLGFIPGVTTDYDLLQWMGHHSGAKLFGVFAVSGLHNVVHLAFGIAGLLMARTMPLRTHISYSGAWSISHSRYKGCSSITTAPPTSFP